MSQDLASHYQAQEWEVSEPPRPHRRNRRSKFTATITVRFTAEEAAIIRELAETRQQTYSEIVRGAIRGLKP